MCAVSISKLSHLDASSIGQAVAEKRSKARIFIPDSFSTGPNGAHLATYVEHGTAPDELESKVYISSEEDDDFCYSCHGTGHAVHSDDTDCDCGSPSGPPCYDDDCDCHDDESSGSDASASPPSPPLREAPAPKRAKNQPAMPESLKAFEAECARRVAASNSYDRTLL